MQNPQSSQKDISPAFKKCSRVPPRNGFLLIELLVAMTLFSIVVAIAVGSFVNVLRTQRQVAALSAAQSNLGIVMEEMAREVRYGSLFCTDGNGNYTCPDGFDFSDVDGNNIKYSLNGGILEKSVNGSTPEKITGNDVEVKYFDFSLLNNVPGRYTRVTVTVGIVPNDVTLSGNVLNLETTVSARKPN